MSCIIERAIQAKIFVMSLRTRVFNYPEKVRTFERSEVERIFYEAKPCK